jgi:Acetyltransferase (GNAT) domain
MNVYITNPIEDGRWDELVQRHPDGSIFHTGGWLRALTQTYGYESIVLTTTPEHRALNNGVVFCKVSSWITGTRLVSVPFADHCEPLVESEDDLQDLLHWLRSPPGRCGWKYVELRPLSKLQSGGLGLQIEHRYRYHELDLTHNIEQIFCKLHKDSIQRRIQHAERVGLSYATGCSTELLDDFYYLLLKTRRRHRLLPQPRAWFKNLLEHMQQACDIKVARHNGVPIAALFTIRHRSVVTYKYGCSDERYHHLGGTPFLLWRLIEESKAQGAQKIDFGRSDLDHRSLTLFKDRFGTTNRQLTYYRYSKRGYAEGNRLLQVETIRRLIAALPDFVSATAGSVLYRHMG